MTEADKWATLWYGYREPFERDFGYKEALSTLPYSQLKEFEREQFEGWCRERGHENEARWVRLWYVHGWWYMRSVHCSDSWGDYWNIGREMRNAFRGWCFHNQLLDENEIKAENEKEKEMGSDEVKCEVGDQVTGQTDMSGDECCEDVLKRLWGFGVGGSHEIGGTRFRRVMGNVFLYVDVTGHYRLASRQVLGGIVGTTLGAWVNDEVKENAEGVRDQMQETVKGYPVVMSLEELRCIAEALRATEDRGVQDEGEIRVRRSVEVKVLRVLVDNGKGNG